jgi:hypothetical protein
MGGFLFFAVSFLAFFYAGLLDDKALIASKWESLALAPVRSRRFFLTMA